MKKLPENATRIWVCEECGHTFADEEIRRDSALGLWGHACKSHPFHKGQRCESHLVPCLPEKAQSHDQD